MLRRNEKSNKHRFRITSAEICRTKASMTIGFTPVIRCQSADGVAMSWNWCWRWCWRWRGWRRAWRRRRSRRATVLDRNHIRAGAPCPPVAHGVTTQLPRRCHLPASSVFQDDGVKCDCFLGKLRALLNTIVFECSDCPSVRIRSHLSDQTGSLTIDCRQNFPSVSISSFHGTKHAVALAAS